jgi:hypothetical protein
VPGLEPGSEGKETTKAEKQMKDLATVLPGKKIAKTTPAHHEHEPKREIPVQCLKS